MSTGQLGSADLGITFAPDFLVADDLAAGALVELVPGWRPPELGVYSVRIGGAAASVKVARLIEHLRGGRSAAPA